MTKSPASEPSKEPANPAEQAAAFQAEAAAYREQSNLVWAGFLLGLVLPAQRFWRLVQSFRVLGSQGQARPVSGNCYPAEEVDLWARQSIAAAGHELGALRSLFDEIGLDLPASTLPAKAPGQPVLARKS